MELRFFKCPKCSEMYTGRTDKSQIQCGALMGFLEGTETPYGCGGIMVEITREQAESIVYESRS